MKNFSGSPLHCNNQTSNHIRERNNRKHGLLSALPLRVSLRGYGFCMATLFLFCFGSLFYQLNGGPPRILLDIRQYLGKNFSFGSAGARLVIKAVVLIKKLRRASRRTSLMGRSKETFMQNKRKEKLLYLKDPLKATASPRPHSPQILIHHS